MNDYTTLTDTNGRRLRDSITDILAVLIPLLAVLMVWGLVWSAIWIAVAQFTPYPV